MEKNLKDIAKELGLNASTVSRAINQKTAHMVKEDTRKKIFDLIKKKGFKPNIKARNLKKQQLTNFSLILPIGMKSIFYDEYYNGIIRGINNRVVDTEYSLTIIPVKEDYTSDDIFNVLLNNETAGLILSPYCKYIEFPVDLLKKYNFPIVSIDNEIQSKSFYNIVLDHEKAGYLGAEAIWKKGLRNIILISDEGHSRHSEMRKKGFYDFLKNKKDCSVINIEHAFSYASAPKVVEELLKINSFPACIFSFNDEIAIGVINELKKKRLNCPKDIEILGFDSLSLGEYSSPKLSSVGFSFEEIGEITAKILIDVLLDKKVNKKTVIEASITFGESF